MKKLQPTIQNNCNHLILYKKDTYSMESLLIHIMFSFYRHWALAFLLISLKSYFGISDKVSRLCSISMVSYRILLAILLFTFREARM